MTDGVDTWVQAVEPACFQAVLDRSGAQSEQSQLFSTYNTMLDPGELCHSRVLRLRLPIAKPSQ